MAFVLQPLLSHVEYMRVQHLDIQAGRHFLFILNAVFVFESNPEISARLFLNFDKLSDFTAQYSVVLKDGKVSF